MIRKALALALLLVALNATADNRKRRPVHLPDSLPASLSPDTFDLPSPLAPGEGLGQAQEPQEERTGIPQGSWQAHLRGSLDSLCQASPLLLTSQLGLYVRDLTTGEDLYALGQRQRLRPASCQKLVTAIAALQLLGPAYALSTDFRFTGEIDDGTLRGDLYAVGRMDPLLSQGDLYAMALRLHELGVDSVQGSLCLDLTFREEADYGWGWCWDDHWGPLRTLTVDGRDAFAQELLSDLSSVGISLADTARRLAPCPSASSLIVRREHSISQLLERMMKQSDNVFAESLFYHIAASSGTPGAGRRQASARIASLISSRLALDPSPYQVADGSGLSLYNYATPELLVALLAYAWRTEPLRSALWPALPVAGVDGTLSKRMRGTPAQGNVRAKTGTVEGVSTLAGYALSSEGHTLAFSIMNQGVSSQREAHAFQDRVCLLLCR